jgi:hypothetical protein
MRGKRYTTELYPQPSSLHFLNSPSGGQLNGLEGTRLHREASCHPGKKKGAMHDEGESTEMGAESGDFFLFSSTGF